MSVEIKPHKADILTESSIVHVICCRNDKVAICGVRDDEWFDTDDDADCAVCIDIEHSTDLCPVDGCQCEVNK